MRPDYARLPGACGGDSAEPRLVRRFGELEHRSPAPGSTADRNDDGDRPEAFATARPATPRVARTRRQPAGPRACPVRRADCSSGNGGRRFARIVNDAEGPADAE